MRINISNHYLIQTIRRKKIQKRVCLDNEEVTGTRSADEGPGPRPGGGPGLDSYMKLLEFVAAEYCRGEEWFWLDLFRALDDELLDPITLTHDGFTSTIRAYIERRKARKRKMTWARSLSRSIFDASNFTKERLITAIQFELTCGNARSMHTAISTILNNSCLLSTVRIVPSVKDIRKATTRINHEFIRMLKPETTVNGFRVDLVNFVSLVLYTVYGCPSTSGVSIDIWGDGMVRGRTDVTRIGFRVTDVPGSTYALETIQNAKHVYVFCVYHGKDKRINLENNIGTSTKIGQRGFLYQQTLKLKQLGAKVTCSGDSPFLLRILSASLSDSSGSHSKLDLFVEDPHTDLIVKTLEPLKKGKPPHFDVKTHKQYQEKMEAIGAILPQTVDRASGRRTRLEIPLIFDLRQDSLVYLDNNLCFCPDGLHAGTRIMEHDLKLHAQFLMDGKREHMVERLGRNVAVRDVKNFSFDINKTTKTIGAVNLTGKQACVIMTPHTELLANGCSTKVCSIFYGV